MFTVCEGIKLSIFYCARKELNFVNLLLPVRELICRSFTLHERIHLSIFTAREEINVSIFNRTREINYIVNILLRVNELHFQYFTPREEK